MAWATLLAIFFTNSSGHTDGGGPKRGGFFLMTGRRQGCQIFLGTTYQNGKNVPKNHKIHQNWKNVPKNIKYTKMTFK
jgi:hypothetical protein